MLPAPLVLYLPVLARWPGGAELRTMFDEQLEHSDRVSLPSDCLRHYVSVIRTPCHARKTTYERPSPLETIWRYTVSEWGLEQAEKYLALIEKGAHLLLDNLARHGRM
ncbi:MAG: type II toxin-antitoxin system RelE/ParE family toxin [Gammaproteobacteria bacterium]